MAVLYTEIVLVDQVGQLSEDLLLVN
jgi:hypothetical protein